MELKTFTVVALSMVLISDAWFSPHFKLLENSLVLRSNAATTRLGVVFTHPCTLSGWSFPGAVVEPGPGARLQGRRGEGCAYRAEHWPEGEQLVAVVAGTAAPGTPARIVTLL